MPNEIVEVMYKLANGLHGKYGYTEQSRGSTQSESNSFTSKAEVQTKIDEVHSKIQKLSRDPSHTVEDKTTLVNELRALTSVKLKFKEQK